MDGPITIERLKCCDWSVHKFIEGNFSKLKDSNQIFRIDFVRIHYHLGEISRQIIECNFFGPYELSINNKSMLKRTASDGPSIYGRHFGEGGHVTPLFERSRMNYNKNK